MKYETTFRTILEVGNLVLFNNLAERSIKSLVMGRKNWLFSQSFEGAQSSAIIMTLFELMNVYAHLEKYDEAKAFLDEYEKEYRLNDLLLVPMMLVALKVGENEVAEDYYRKLLKENSDVTKFLRLIKKEGEEGVEMIADEPNDGYYRPNSLESLVLCFGRLAKTIDLNYFAEWLIVTKKTLTKKK